MTANALIVVQARMGSTRLPGKVLMDLGGRPMLAVMLERVRRVPGADVVVATSDRSLDDPVVECAGAADVAVVRGDEADVLGRFALAVERSGADHVVRLTADCPLIDPGLVADVVARHVAYGAAYTSNTVIRTHPDGLDVEVMTADALRTAAAEAIDAAEREHVTPFLYRRPSRFELAAVHAVERWGHLRWTVDDAEDLARLRAMVSGNASSGTWEESLARLPAAERSPLRDGLQPARGTECGRPADRVLDLVVGGRDVGRVRIRIADGGAASIDLDVPTGHLAAAYAHLDAIRRQTAQITSISDLSEGALT